MSEIKKIYDEYGAYDYIGESITQMNHALQCAELANEEGAPEEIIIAVLLHDIGHLLGIKYKCKEMKGKIGIEKHEEIGAEYLKKVGLSETICEIVKNHVKTKRYLVTKDSKYMNTLSEGSKLTLIEQGGKMTEEECVKYEKEPLFKWHLKMREWDDRGKELNKNIDAEKYWNMLEKYV